MKLFPSLATVTRSPFEVYVASICVCTSFRSCVSVSLVDHTLNSESSFFRSSVFGLRSSVFGGLVAFGMVPLGSEALAR